MAKRNPPATPADYQKVIDMDAQGVGCVEGSKLLGLPHQTYYTRLKRAKATGYTPGPVEEMSEMATEVQDLKDQIRRLTAELRTTRRESITAKAVRAQICKLAEHAPKPPSWTIKPKRLGDAGIPVTVWSDWHWGEVVDPAQVNGINEYNMEIARNRVKRLVEKIISLAMHHQVDADYPGIVVMLLGDMVSGDIHAELKQTNEMPTMPTFLDLYEVLAWALGKLADAFGRVFVASSPGNHSRLTIKPIYKGRHYSNWDWLLGVLLEKHFKATGDKRVQIYAPNSTDCHLEIAGHRFMGTHGDALGVRGGDGIIGSIGPIIRGDVKTRGQSESIGMGYETLVMGHWHQYMPLDRVVVNGSLIGFNEYAKLHLRARPEAPRQSLFFVHPEWGVINHWPIYVSKPKPRAKASWVRWPEAA